MSMTHTASHAIPRQPRCWGWLATFATFALRAYVALVWIRFGLAKLQDGWLTTNPLRPLLATIGSGQLPTTAPGYAPMARLMVHLHIDAVLSVAIPIVEVAIAVALLSGRWVRTAALVACALNLNLLLAGVASWSLDGRMIVLQLIIVALATLMPRR